MLNKYNSVFAIILIQTLTWQPKIIGISAEGSGDGNRMDSSISNVNLTGNIGGIINNRGDVSTDKTQPNPQVSGSNEPTVTKPITAPEPFGSQIPY